MVVKKTLWIRFKRWLVSVKLGFVLVPMQRTPVKVGVDDVIIFQTDQPIGGVSAQRIEEEIKSVFPDQKILIMDGSMGQWKVWVVNKRRKHKCKCERTD